MAPPPKHGHTRRVGSKTVKSSTYQSWSAMNDRCYNETHKWYKAYGGRGIEVCEEWRRGNPNAFVNFLRDMGERPAPELTLDRIECDGNYHKDNCRWATKSCQRINQRPVLPPSHLSDEDIAAFAL